MNLTVSSDWQHGLNDSLANLSYLNYCYLLPQQFKTESVSLLVEDYVVLELSMSFHELNLYIMT